MDCHLKLNGKHFTKKVKKTSHHKIIADTKTRPIFGSGKGKMWIADDFDDMLDELKEYME